MGGLSNSLVNSSLSPMDGLHDFWDEGEILPKQSKVDTSFPKNMSSPHGYNDVLQDVADTYPALAPHAKNAIAYDATPAKGNTDSLETYPAWEDYNPHPGKHTVELYRSYSNREQLKDALAGEMIHIAGSIHPETGKPVDPKYYEFKKQVKLARTPKQKEMDYRTYKESGDKRSFGKWFENSRAEDYVRGRLFPDPDNDEWKHIYEENPKLRKVIDNLGKYLRTGK